MNVFRQSIVMLAGAALLTSCPGGERPPATTAYAFITPDGLPPPSLPADNPLTVEGLLLGRQLFYDPILSGDSTQSCSSCHDPVFAFTDNGNQFSEGIDGSIGDRNSMAVFNMAWHKGFFWDSRAATLREQALGPITNPVEMKADMADVLYRLNASDRYSDMFWKAFGVKDITENELALALEQFMLSIVSGKSKFDQVVAGDATFTDSEQRGLTLFNSEANPNSATGGADCFHCHGNALFTNHEFMNNGLDSVLTDLGLGGHTGLSHDEGKFKVPSLRNLAYTAPYMHDGRFSSLAQVIEFYNSGVHPSSPNISTLMVDFLNGGLNLSFQDKLDLIAFLTTLNDPYIETDTLYQNPFE